LLEVGRGASAWHDKPTEGEAAKALGITRMLATKKICIAKHMDLTIFEVSCEMV